MKLGFGAVMGCTASWSLLQMWTLGVAPRKVPGAMNSQRIWSDSIVFWWISSQCLGCIFLVFSRLRLGRALFVAFCSPLCGVVLSRSTLSEAGQYGSGEHWSICSLPELCHCHHPMKRSFWTGAFWKPKTNANVMCQLWDAMISGMWKTRFQQIGLWSWSLGGVQMRIPYGHMARTGMSTRVPSRVFCRARHSGNMQRVVQIHRTSPGVLKNVQICWMFAGIRRFIKT